MDRGFSEGVSAKSFAVSQPGSQVDETESLLSGSRASKAQSRVSYGHNSVDVPHSMATSISDTVVEEKEQSEALSDDSSITQYSENFGDTPQDVSPFLETSDGVRTGPRWRA